MHRLLGVGFGGRIAHDADHPLDADLIVVDEASMLDLLLANMLVKAVPPGAHLLLVGDVDQLPSVGPGNVLADLIAAGTPAADDGGGSTGARAAAGKRGRREPPRVQVVRLQVIFRQAAESGIIANAHRILRGERPELRQYPDFRLVAAEDPPKRWRRSATCWHGCCRARGAPGPGGGWARFRRATSRCSARCGRARWARPT